MKPEDIKDLRELLGNIEFANAELQQATQKLEQFKDIEKLVPVLNSIKEIDLGKHIQKIDFTKIGEEVFQGVRQSINAQNTIITNSVQALEKKSKDLNAIVQDLQELDELSISLQTLKKGIQGFNTKMIAGSLILGLGLGTIGGYVYSAYIQPKPFEKLLSKRAYTVEESNGYKDILVITTPFQSGNFKDGSAWIAFTFPQQTNQNKEQK
ncbi:MAG: hypothetical protein PHN18_10310 [Sulfurospirillaceae bacterium]|nr:hypothetical protein [Sulfurospirillaceae bacterium]MDD2827468.1 hypothetical protein [Sulfurospirillaceae bacterium]